MTRPKWNFYMLVVLTCIGQTQYALPTKYIVNIVNILNWIFQGKNDKNWEPLKFNRAELSSDNQWKNFPKVGKCKFQSSEAPVWHYHQTLKRYLAENLIVYMTPR